MKGLGRVLIFSLLTLFSSGDQLKECFCLEREFLQAFSRQADLEDLQESIGGLEEVDWEPALFILNALSFSKALLEISAWREDAVLLKRAVALQHFAYSELMRLRGRLLRRRKGL